MARAWHALAAYTLVALVATWPLALGLGRDVGWDLGDPLFVMWALAWDCEQLLAILGGDVSRVATFFDANIFYPAPLTLAYSEHFIAQAVQVLPIYAASRNPILCYNLLFLSTFVLSGLGTYLFVRDLTGSPRAAFLAGLLFAVAPYRVPQSAHLQVLSSQWMPFAFYGIRRYFASLGEAPSRRVLPLAGASLALVLQNLSCGYYLLYFSPLLAAYVLSELAHRGVWRDWRVCGSLAAAGVLVAAMTAPFLVPYAQARRDLPLERSRSEVVRYSADVYSYATAYSEQPVWGSFMRAFPKPEGELFPGAAAITLALVGLLFWRPPSRIDAPRPAGREPRRRRVLTRVFAAAAVLHLLAATAGLVYRRILLELWVFEISIRDINQMLLRAAALAAVALAISPRARTRAALFMQSRGFFAAALVAALWLSLGPVPQALGRPLDLASPYGVLYNQVPGFDGLRVPARLAMIVSFMMAVLGGYGAAVLARARASHVLLPVLAALILAEGLVLPFPLNVTAAPGGFATPEPRVHRPSRAPAVYHEVARQPDGIVLAELPLGTPEYDLRAVFYSTAHWRPVINGYSGFFPPHYPQLAVDVSDVPRYPGAAMDALRAAGATHVLVHERAYLGDDGARTSSALRTEGATEIFRAEGDVLLALAPTP